MNRQERRLNDIQTLSNIWQKDSNFQNHIEEVAIIAAGPAGDTFTKLGAVGRFIAEWTPVNIFYNFHDASERRYHRALARAKMYKEGIIKPEFLEWKPYYIAAMVDTIAQELS